MIVCHACLWSLTDNMYRCRENTPSLSGNRSFAVTWGNDGATEQSNARSDPD
jgi:hypothetical protein